MTLFTFNKVFSFFSVTIVSQECMAAKAIFAICKYGDRFMPFKFGLQVFLLL
jgi:hypothetical protein